MLPVAAPASNNDPRTNGCTGIINLKCVFSESCDLKFFRTLLQLDKVHFTIVFGQREMIQIDEVYRLHITGNFFFAELNQFLRQLLVRNVFLLDNNEVTIKRASFSDGKLTLKAANPAYEDRSFSPDEVRILGKVLHNKVLF